MHRETTKAVECEDAVRISKAQLQIRLRLGGGYGKFLVCVEPCHPWSPIKPLDRAGSAIGGGCAKRKVSDPPQADAPKIAGILAEVGRDSLKVVGCRDLPSVRAIFSFFTTTHHTSLLLACYSLLYPFQLSETTLRRIFFYLPTCYVL